MKRGNRTYLVYILMFLAIMIGVKVFLDSASKMSQKEYSLNQLYEDIESEKVKEIQYKLIEGSGGAAELIITLKDDEAKIRLEVPLFVEYTKEFQELSRKYGIDYKAIAVPRRTALGEMLTTILVTGLMMGIVVFFFMQMNSGGGGGNKVMNFGKNKAKMVPDDQKKVTFDDVAGLDEEKLELSEVVDFLKRPKKYVDIGARIPKGVLLVGPPGTGKTLLAKAVSGEAGVPFFSISGSDFVEMFVGVGASRVRDLFDNAKKNMPCIVFIDEIDAVGRRRGAGLGGGHDEREQTLNQLLVEMDGFGVNEGVIIIAATNRQDILDPALLRPGRFDRQVEVGRPDVKGRKEILKVHSKGKKIAADVDYDTLALSTSGFTGADLENLLNESAILSARAGEKEITMNRVRNAFIKVGIGTEKKSKVVTKEERNLTAYHETGHAIMHEVLPHLDPVHIISIIPTGYAGGYTMFAPSEEEFFKTKTRLEEELISLLGGRAAEDIVLGDISTGAGQDISRASTIARDMVMKYGMSEKLGPVMFSTESEEVFIGRDMSQGRNYGETKATEIDDEVNNIINHAYAEAKRILKEYDDILHKTAKLLLEKEKITGDEFRALFPEGVLTKEINKNFLGLTEETIDIVVDDSVKLSKDDIDEKPEDDRKED